VACVALDVAVPFEPPQWSVTSLYWSTGTVREPLRPHDASSSSNAFASFVGKAARAPCISIFRKYLLPRLVMPNKRGLPPVVACRGTRPSHAARLRPRAKVSASPTAAISAVALSAPIPGMLVSRRAASSRFASTANSASNAAILSSSASYRVSMSSIRSWIRELSSPAPCRRSSVIALSNSDIAPREEHILGIKATK